MTRCPNPGCPFAARHGYAAEYRDGFDRCSDCGTALVAAEAKVAPRAADVGNEKEPPLRIAQSAPDQFASNVLLSGGVAVALIGLTLGVTRGVPLALLAGGLLAVALGFKLRTGSVDGSLERRERGITFRRGDQTWSVAWAEIEAASLTEHPLPGPKPMKRARYQLLLRLKDGQSMAIDTTVTGLMLLDDPFVAWAREVEKKY